MEMSENQVKWGLVILFGFYLFLKNKYNPSLYQSQILMFPTYLPIQLFTSQLTIWLKWTIQLFLLDQNDIGAWSDYPYKAPSHEGTLLCMTSGTTNISQVVCESAVFHCKVLHFM